MNKLYWSLSPLALAVAYWVRPALDFAWVVLSRAREAAAMRWGPSLLRREHGTVVQRAVEQHDEIKSYLHAQIAATQAEALRALDFSGPGPYEKSVQPLRARLQASLRYPPPGLGLASGPVEEVLLGEDEVATYRELRIPVLPGVHATGIYVRPRASADDQPLPLVIAAHGRNLIPAAGADGKLPVLRAGNRDIALGTVQRGHAVWLPSFVHFGKEAADELRGSLTVLAWEAGSSLPAIEIAKVVKAIDVLAARPGIDAGRIAMVGQSYGGFYCLYTTALEPRIRVAVVSAYLNDRAALLHSTAPTGYLDWRFDGSLALWQDPAVVALVAPRPLLVEAGNQDQLFPIEGARRAAAQARTFYQRLGLSQRFRFAESVARHDFDAEQAWDFIDRHLSREAAVPPAAAGVPAR